MIILFILAGIILLPLLIKSIWVLAATNTNEKKDILKRRAWLIQKTSGTAKELIDSMPSSVGPQFQGEWAIYTYSMFAHALTNISRLYPETKNRKPICYQTSHQECIVTRDATVRQGKMGQRRTVG